MKEINFLLVDTIVIETPFKKILLQSMNYQWLDAEHFDMAIEHIPYFHLLEVAKQVKQQLPNNTIVINIKGCDLIRISDVKFIDINQSTHTFTEEKFNKFIKSDFLVDTKEEVIEILRGWEV
ncbi:hypothetical protein EVU91_02315 [Macrococcoides bohemicum]|uniref:hypothetical protein n=1 Tax=Macrococcoides bohemicum TaxID=1903056 RepID=UPI00105972DC|nr:hypothetical protein [Macrococcus bohemicus]TDL40748.1 hypothetical protein EVU91_02315 [Macrococcus bohemicus]